MQVLNVTYGVAADIKKDENGKVLQKKVTKKALVVLEAINPEAMLDKLSPEIVRSYALKEFTTTMQDFARRHLELPAAGGPGMKPEEVTKLILDRDWNVKQKGGGAKLAPTERIEKALGVGNLTQAQKVKALQDALEAAKKEAGAKG